MPPKQSTLGMFFTLPEGMKPPAPVQTRLKSRAKKTQVEEGGDDGGGASTSPTIRKRKAPAKKSPVKTPAKSTAATKKVKAEEEAEDEIMVGTPEAAAEPDLEPEESSDEEEVAKKSPTTRSRRKAEPVKKQADVTPTRKGTRQASKKKGEPEASPGDEESVKEMANATPAKKGGRQVLKREGQTKGSPGEKPTAKTTVTPAKKGARGDARPKGEPEESAGEEIVAKNIKTTAKKRARESLQSKNQPELSSKEEPVNKRNRRSSSTEEPVTKRKRRPSGTEAVKKAAKASSSSKVSAPAKAMSPVKSSPTAAAAKMEATEESDAESSTVDLESDTGEASSEEKPALTEKVGKAVVKKLTGEAVKHAYPDWPAGSPTPYAALVSTFQLLEATTKRLEKISHTSLFLRQVLRVSPDELLLVIHLMINKLAADFEGIELGIGESMLMKAIGESCGRSMDKIREDHKESGDLGVVAMRSRNNQRTLFPPNPLTVASVHQGLLEIATTKGEGSQGRKVSGIMKLLAAAKGEEAKYLVRGLEGKLRLGLAEITLIASLSGAVMAHEAGKNDKKVTPSMLTAAELTLKSVFSELPSYEVIIPAMAKHGIMNLKDHCKLQPGVPLKPMLAKPTKAISEVLDQFENKRFTCEFKYDGERAQIHFVSPKSSIEYPPASTTEPATKGIAKVFSRNSEDLSKKYPDILAALDKWVKPGVESFVLDCEAVAWDKVQKRVLPFQQLMTRKRKDVAIEDVKIKVCVFAFDMLFLNGKPLVKETLEERRRLMQESFSEVEGEFTFAKYMDGNELEQIQTFLDESVKASCEGLMVKTLDGEESGYEPSKRSRNWLKIKKDYLNGIGDSLDLVVLGAYHGRGKRTSVYGAFLLACYNPQSQVYETICNIGTGFSEVNLEAFHEQLSELEIDKPKMFYVHAEGNQSQPDVWFEPKIVWEVKAADLSLSPRYKAAAGLADTAGGNKGVSLRFPRFIRVRDDKGPEQATTSSQVADMYRRQEVVINNRGSKAKAVDDDFEY